ncbi:MAG: nucleotidyltransferase domain-containing protein [Candidatus Latescibacterota bacterium]|jgi:predicted nucleotidyltransferase
MSIESRTRPATEVALPQTVDLVVSTIAKACNPDRILLFGSAVNGTSGPDSDLDLLVIMDTDLPRHRRAAPLRLLFDPYPCPMDILVYTSQEVDRWRGATNHIIAEALRTGRVVYERA